MANPRGNPETQKRFSSTYQPKNRGRKPSKLKQYISDNGLGIQDIRLMMKTILAMDEAELQEKIKDRETPMMIRLFIRAYMEDFKTGRLDNFDKMVDRIFGKSTETISVSGNMEHDITTMTKKEREKLIDEYIEKRKS